MSWKLERSSSRPDESPSARRTPAGTSQREKPRSRSRPQTATAPGIALDRLGNVAVRVGIAVQDEAEARADDGEVGEVDGADERVGRTIEVERQEQAARLEHPVDLVDRTLSTGTLRMPYPVVTTSNCADGEGQRHHVAGDPAWLRAARPAWPRRARSMRGVTSSAVVRAPRRLQRVRDVAGAAREIERGHAGRASPRADETPLPAAVLPVREQAGDEVVAIGDGREEPADVALLVLWAWRATRGGRRDRRLAPEAARSFDRDVTPHHLGVRTARVRRARPARAEPSTRPSANVPCVRSAASRCRAPDTIRLCE